MARLVVFVLSLILLAVPVYAQEELSVRSGVHPSYTRIVFDWPSASEYTLDAQAQQLTLTFDKPAVPDLTSITDRDLPNVKSVKVLSEAGQSLKLQMAVPKGSTHRHFRVGSRIVVDVYNPGGGSEVIAAKKKTAPAKKVAAAAPPKKELPAKPKEGKPAEVLPKIEKKEVTEAPAPPVVQEKLLPPDIDPHVIKVTSTKAVGMAVFQRGDWLWLILDEPNMSVPPQLAGPQKERFSKFERFDLPNATAYRLLIPQNAFVYGEGGGLLWRIIVTPNRRDISPVEPENEFAGSNPVRGGTILWPFADDLAIVKIKDPAVGDTVTVVTVEDSGEMSGPPREFVELSTLPTAVGLALVPKIDDLDVQSLPEGIVASAPSGLALARPRDAEVAVLREAAAAAIEEEEEDDAPKAPPISRIYNFESWEMGGISSLDQNQSLLLNGLRSKEQQGRIEDLLTIAKLNLANRRGYEALGFLQIAMQEFPELKNNPEYIALRGAAKALSNKPDEAMKDFASPKLTDYGELGYWKAYALANMEDWQEATKVMPPTLDLLVEYPRSLREPIGLALTEVALRDERIGDAEGALALLETHLEDMILPYNAAWQYLTGETHRQLGNPDKAIEHWSELAKGKDDLYRARAGLALTKLELEQGKIKPRQAVDRLEGLRYAWRGDELEMMINFDLGKIYIDNNKILKGLSVLRNAVSFDPTSDGAKKLTSYMTEIFQNLFVGDNLQRVSALEAVTIYDQFTELTPTGKDGDRLVEALANRLVEADLLGRAIKLLEHQLDHRLKGEEAGMTAIQLAAVQMLDEKPVAGLKTLERAEGLLKKSIGRVPPAQAREMKLLEIRALSQLNKTDEALEMLEALTPDRNTNQLKADIAWRASRWEDAAEALSDLIYAEDISLTRPLTPRQTDLILNRALALNLANNRVAIANLREKYSDAMRQTEKFDLFEVVTRPRQAGYAGNRDAITGIIAEVDLFKDFLDTYRETNKASN